MLVKFETKSARVKGISFHPTRPFLLVSLRTGGIQLWDYQLGQLRDTYADHEGPVRGIAFHHSQSLFVSGGDDYHVKVWNYQQRRCLFTLHGHMDYVRSTAFHPRQPWALSTSDDQTIRIWNYQSRKQIALLTGHSHYVMHAAFHPTQDLIVSGSLDQTIRVWNLAPLVKKHAVAKQNISSEQSSSKTRIELFSDPDFVLLYVMERHEKGVNWVNFHPTMPLVVSASDDRNIKVFRMGEEKMWEIDTYHGHYNNVSSVMFHPTQPLIISVSEDKSLRVWDMAQHRSHSCLQTFRRQHDRFWVVTGHPSKGLFCAGHDAGIILFKLKRERPMWTLLEEENAILYTAERLLRRVELSSGQDYPIMQLRTDTNSNYLSMKYNHAENCILLSHHEAAYELYVIPGKETDNLPPNPDHPQDWKKSIGKTAVWIGRNRFAVLNSESSIQIKTAKNEVHKKIQLPFKVSHLFAAGVGMLMIQQKPNPLDGIELKENREMVLFDVQLKKVVAKTTVQCLIKSVIWSPDRSKVALLGKSTVILANNRLNVFTTFTEREKVKSGVWRQPGKDVGVFMYNTSSHLKYGLVNGDGGIIRTLEVPIYLVQWISDLVVCFDRSPKVLTFNVDTVEIQFKIALLTNDYSEVMKMIHSSKLVGQAIIAYIHSKGHTEIALHFSQRHDVRTRFNLALECGNVEVGLECARVLDRLPVWNKLAEVSMLLGNYQTAEMCYQRTRNTPKLSFLYLITGNQEKLKKLMKVSAAQEQPLSWQYWMALVSGDPESLVKILQSFGDLGKTIMAVGIADAYGLSDQAEKIRSSLPEDKAPKPNSLGYKPNYPPTPLIQQIDNWPLLQVSKSIFGNTSSTILKSLEDSAPVETPIAGEWAEDDFPEQVWNDNEEKPIQDVLVKQGDGWDDESSDVVIPTVADAQSSDEATFVLPSRGLPVPITWTDSYRIPVVHLIAGNFESAARILNEQFGITHIAPLKDLFVGVYQRSHMVVPVSPNTPSLSHYSKISFKDKPSYPQACDLITLDSLTKTLKTCYDHVTKGAFLEASYAFQALLYSIPLVTVKSKGHLVKAQQLVVLCKEYILGMKMELYRKTISKDPDQQQRNLELAAYFTHLSMDNIHLMLALRTAMNLSFKQGCFKNAVSFATRLIELGPSGELGTQARKLLKASENKPNNSTAELNYDEHNPFSVCGKTYKPIYRGRAEIKCPFCQAAFMPEFKGILCEVCNIAEVGKEAQGFQIPIR